MADELIGHRVARYEITAFLGDELLGKVYRAVEMPQKRRVLLKVLDPHKGDSFEAGARFQREMTASAMLAEHPNTVRMLDFGDHRGIFHYLVLEDVDATTLAATVHEEETLEVERVAQIAYQIADALSAAHGAGVSHRNLRPENVLLLDDLEGDYAKVRDFGLARLDENEGQQLTSAGTRVGTTEYMAPEYIEQGESGPPGDIYALGCLMFFMLTGKPPYTGSKAEVLDLHVSAPIPKPSDEVDGVPKWMDALIERLLAKDPKERPTAQELMGLIEKGAGKKFVLPRLPDAAERATRAPKTNREVAPDKKSGPSGTAVAAGAAGAGVVIIVIVVLGAVLGGIVVIGFLLNQ